MSTEREKIEMQMKEMSFEDLQKRHEERNKAKGTPKRSFGKFLGSILFWRFKVFAGILGINEKDITESRRGASMPSSGTCVHNGYSRGPRSDSRKFRDGYHFDPEVELKREIAADAYFRAAGFDDLAR